jgi:hypothetical protein
MGKDTIFSLGDAKYLQSYYAKLVLGKELQNGSTIFEVVIRKVDNGFVVKCVSSPYQSDFDTLISNVATVAKELNLPSPSDVLSSRH